ncbi:MAG: hypothetical protein JWP74_975 [Marmoricola sp.]|nr:hypothetical protein [Marmoricola sp.]
MGRGQGGRLWHVTLTVAGEPVEPMLVRGALTRLREERPFIDTLEYTGSGAELQFWDEGDAMLDVASLALRLWAEHRVSAGLPSWEIVGLEVVEKSVRDSRLVGRPTGLQSSTSMPYQL